MIKPNVMLVTYDPEKLTVEAIANTAADSLETDHAYPDPVPLIYLNYSPKPI